MRPLLRSRPPTDEPGDDRRGSGSSTAVGPWLLWFAVLGAPVAWFVHLVAAWMVTELACISPAPGELVDNRGGSPGAVAWTLVIVGTALPWLVAAASVVASFVALRRHRRAAAAGRTDPLAGERVPFLLTVGTLLGLLSLAAITGGIVAELTLEVCG